MANYSVLLADIASAIYENHNNEIDALDLKGVLDEMVASLGDGYLLKKTLATPSTNPGTPDTNVAYFATQAGTYTNFDGIQVVAGEVALLCWDGSWTKLTTGAMSAGAIVDNLTTNDATKPLSAKQGKVLKDAQDATNAEVAALGQKAGVLYDGSITAGDTIFDTTYVKPGDIVYIRAKTLTEISVRVALYDSSNNVIASFSPKVSAIGDAIDFYIRIPEGFYTAKAEWHNYTLLAIANPESLKGAFVQRNIDNPLWRIGDMGLSGDGKNLSFNTSTTRVSMLPGMGVRCFPGDKIGLTDYTSGRRYYLYWITDAGLISTSGGWLTADHSVTAEADYFMLIRNNPETTILNANDLGKYFFIKRKEELDTENNIAGLNTNVTRIKGMLSEAVKNAISIADFEIGSVNISGSGWSYSANDSRIRTKQNFTYHLMPGTIISLLPAMTNYIAPNLVGPLFYVGWRRADGTYGNSGAWVDNFSVTEEGDYVLCLRFRDNHTLSSISELFKYLKIRSDFDDVLYKTENAQLPASYFKTINHRGYNTIAPENTLPAFALSKNKGFAMVETDIRQTWDGVYVLLHDTSINRTATNDDGTAIGSTINIADITYAQALTYDFGQWKDAKYAGTRIPTLEQFLVLCRNLGLHAYLELKLNTQAYVEGIVNLVNAYGMAGNVSYIGGSTALGYVKAVAPKARLGLVISDLASSDITAAQGLKSDDNEVFLTVWHYKNDATQLAAFAAAKAAGIPFEVWVINTEYETNQLDPYISGMTTNVFDASQMFFFRDLQDNTIF